MGIPFARLLPRHNTRSGLVGVGVPACGSLSSIEPAQFAVPLEASKRKSDFLVNIHAAAVALLNYEIRGCCNFCRMPPNRNCRNGGVPDCRSATFKNNALLPVEAIITLATTVSGEED